MANNGEWLTTDTGAERCADYVVIQLSLDRLKTGEFESKEEHDAAVEYVKKEHKKSEERTLDQLEENYYRGKLKGIIEGGVAALTGVVIGDIIFECLVKLLDKKK